MTLKAPFPWFGGKSRCAHLVWARFGCVPNYVEPFFGSGAVLLGRPHEARTETVNDKDCYLSNFWRAVQHDPESVAAYADWPVNEADLHARHRWLVEQHGFRERMMGDPDYFDARIALCGYDGEHKMPLRWASVAWKANGGYGNQASGRGRANARRERIWFSPHCLRPVEVAS